MAKKTATNAKESQTATSDSMTLQVLRLVKMESSLGDLRPNQLPGIAVQNVTFNIGSNPETKDCVVLADLSLSAHYEEPKTDEQKPALMVRAIYELVYTITDKNVVILIESHELADSIQNVVAMNVWPYWREFVQSLTPRMGLPVFPVPLLHPHIEGSKVKSVLVKPKSKR